MNKFVYIYILSIFNYLNYSSQFPLRTSLWVLAPLPTLEIVIDIQIEFILLVICSCLCISSCYVTINTEDFLKREGIYRQDLVLHSFHHDFSHIKTLTKLFFRSLLSCNTSNTTCGFPLWRNSVVCFASWLHPQLHLFTWTRGILPLNKDLLGFLSWFKIHGL